MGKLQAFEVLFDGNVDVYRAGDTITGHVRLVLNEAKEFKGKRFQQTIDKISNLQTYLGVYAVAKPMKFTSLLITCKLPQYFPNP